MTARRTPDLLALARGPRFAGFSDITLVARDPFWDEEALPFRLHGGGAVVRVEPERGFRKESLAGTADERLLLVDCPDAPGWLAPSGVVAGWMARNVRNAALDDLLLGHPLYEHLTKVDGKGRSRGGRMPLAAWTPGVPTLAHVAAPEFLPDDPEAPAVNRLREAHAEAAAALLAELEAAFPLVEVEVGARLAARPPGRRRRT